MNETALLPPEYKLVNKPDDKPGFLMRGPRPDDSIMKAVFEPFKTVFNLETGWFEFFHQRVFAERQVCLAMNVVYAHLPMSDVWTPTPTELATIVKMIGGALDRGNVLVHCLHGEDRTGMVCGAYRIIAQGWTAESAKAEMFELGFHKIPYLWWAESLDELYDAVQRNQLPVTK